MYKGFINDVMNARDTTFLYIVESPGHLHTLLTICPIDTKFLVIVSTCKTFRIIPLWLTLLRRTSSMCSIGYTMLSPVNIWEPFFMVCHMIGSGGVDLPHFFQLRGATPIWLASCLIINARLLPTRPEFSM